MDSRKPFKLDDIPFIRKNITVKVSNDEIEQNISFPDELFFIEFLKSRRDKFAEILKNNGFNDQLPLDLHYQNINLWLLNNNLNQTLIRYEIIHWENDK